MCLYPRLTKNRKYTANKKNGGIIPEIKDTRVLMVPVGCGKCMECRKQKARAWSIRLQEEIRTHERNYKQFVTLTFSNESIKELAGEIKGLKGYELDNEIATLGTRRFLERWRKNYKISIKHWLVTELGHNGTENVHLHGILFLNQYKHWEGLKQMYLKQQINDIEKIWKYGWVYIGDYVNEQTINYIGKYVTKVDLQHKEYNAKILTSPGIGNNYTNRLDAKLNKYKEKETKETYTTRQGTKINLPIYYRNKIYTESEKEQLWLDKLDKQERWVDGKRVSIKNGEEQYYKMLEIAQIKNKRLGYGDNTVNWERINYENERRQLIIQQRLEPEEKEIYKKNLLNWERLRILANK